MRKTKLYRLYVALTLALTLALFASPALAAFKATINSSAAKVYKSASTGSSGSVSAVKGVTVSVTAYSGSWARISYRGRSGYMQIKYLDLNNRIKAYAAKAAPVYKSAASSSSKLGTLSRGDTVYVIGVSGGYLKIEDSSGSATGFVRSSYLSTKKPSDGSSAAATAQPSATSSAMPSGVKSATSSYSSGMSRSEKLEYVIYVAQSQLNKPYSASPNPPSSYDCSRLVRYCMKKGGFSVKSTSQAQGYDEGLEKIESASDLKRGDVVCFNTNTSDSDLSDHTGIYLGSGYFIHASSGAGKVIVSTLSSGYYKTAFSWGRRP